MVTIANRLRNSKTLILIYLLGIIFQTIYLPFQARETAHLQAAATDAGYSWAWDRPLYFDYENNVNISVTDRQAWMAQNRNIKNSNTDLEKTMYSGKGTSLDALFSESKNNEIKMPATWIRIFGIDYKRLLLTFSLWTVIMGCALFILKTNKSDLMSENN